MSSNIAIFASGSGSNAEAIIKYFTLLPGYKINHIFTNRPHAYVIERAKNHHIPYTYFSKEEFYNSNKVIEILKDTKTDYILLAGFMMLIPPFIIEQFPDRMLNIHPALLPKYGGKGMYGKKVHEAVINAGEKYSGITIHKVNENYDEGDIIFQARCRIDSFETPESLAEKVHSLEHYYYPRVAERFFSGQPIPHPEEL